MSKKTIQLVAILIVLVFVSSIIAYPLIFSPDNEGPGVPTTELPEEQS